MLVVTVEILVRQDRVEDFRRAVIANAAASRREEPACRQFDVDVPVDDPRRVFLYEVYDDRAQFDAHLRTAHFKAFDAQTSAWIESKSVRLLERLDPS